MSSTAPALRPRSSAVHVWASVLAGTARLGRNITQSHDPFGADSVAATTFAGRSIVAEAGKGHRPRSASPWRGCRSQGRLRHDGAPFARDHCVRVGIGARCRGGAPSDRDASRGSVRDSARQLGGGAAEQRRTPAASCRTRSWPASLPTSTRCTPWPGSTWRRHRSSWRAPNFGDRYYSFQIGYADTECDLCPGLRTHGPQLPPLFLHGPAYRGPVPEAMLPVASRTRYLMIAGRILVATRGPRRRRRGAPAAGADHAAHAAPVGVRSRRPQPGPRPASAAHHRRRRRPGPCVPSPTRRRPRRRGCHPCRARPRHLVLAARAARRPERSTRRRSARPIGPTVIAGLRDGEAMPSRRRSGISASAGNGWSVNLRGSRFGDDYLLRAAVAKNQIYVVPAEEAVYPVTRVDGNGDRLDGRNRYRLVLDSPPPADAFWSLTVYGTPGPLDRQPVGPLCDRRPDAWSRPRR